MIATRRLVLASALAVLAACSKAAPAGGDPVALVQGLYAPYLAKAERPNLLEDAAPLTRDLKRLMLAARDLSVKNNEPNAVVDFDPIVDAQDWEITDVHSELVSPIQNDRAGVRANFKNFGEAGAVTYTLLREDGAWRIDDMAGKDWTLRHLLAELGIGAAR